MRYRYGWAWHEHLRKPTREMSEKQARKAWDKGPQLTVAALDGDGDDVVPAYTITTDAGGGTVAVNLYDAADSLVRSFDYDLVDGRLFLSGTTTWTYADADRVHEVSDAQNVRSLYFKPDGYARIRPATDGSGDVEERTGVDVSGHWLDPLEWGEWDRVGHHRPELAEL